MGSMYDKAITTIQIATIYAPTQWNNTRAAPNPLMQVANGISCKCSSCPVQLFCFFVCLFLFFFIQFKFNVRFRFSLWSFPVFLTLRVFCCCFFFYSEALLWFFISLNLYWGFLGLVVIDLSLWDRDPFLSLSEHRSSVCLACCIFAFV